MTTDPPEQGQMVTVRQRQWVVADVRASSVEFNPLEAGTKNCQNLVTLRSIEDDSIGEELQVVWEIEPGAIVREKTALPSPDALDPPGQLDAFMDAIRWGASSTADRKTIQSPFRSGIKIEEYQLDPVVRAIQMPRVNLLIADDVGLGKTIEAGMTALELMIRHRARRILIVCPAGLQIQWHDQMRDKFGLEFSIVDSELMKRLRRKRGIRANPWSHYPRLITSIDYLKRERVLRQFRETLPAEGESIYPRRYDMLILDEAHNCAPSGRGKYATDSLRTQAVRQIAPHFEHKLFLTATPHNGYTESFSALLELLDDQRFARGTVPDRQQLSAVMVRRLKSELTDFDGRPLFPERRLESLEVAYPDAERDVHAALQQYGVLRQKGVSDGAERLATEFVLKTLKKRLFSSPAAFAATLEQHERSLRESTRRKGTGKPSLSILQRHVDRVEEAGDEDEMEGATNEAVETAAKLFRDPTTEERELLKHMRRWAEASRSKADAKTAVLIEWLRQCVLPGGRWSDERVIIFTEYRATQVWLHERLVHAGFTGAERIMLMHGGMDTEQREDIKAAFQEEPRLSPVRILIATDAASEGIDLQNYCSRLIHFEIPWNPNRMEQRNGRIDRHGQKADSVQIYHFVGNGYRKRIQAGEGAPDAFVGDLEFLMQAAEKVNTIREDLGKVGPVIAQQVEEAMLGRRKRLDTSQAEKQAEPVRQMLKFERDLRQHVQQLHDQLHETRNELHLTPANVRKVVEVGLQVADQPALIPTEVEGIWAKKDGTPCPVFRLPPFKGSWAPCSEGLIRKHTGEERPVVFDHALAQGRNDVVLIHLNHRLVQMCLRLLRAEVWSPTGTSKLQRVTCRTVSGGNLPHPALIAHARLVVIGGGSHRLHEELISAGGILRNGRFSRLNVGQVEDALQHATDEEPSEGIKKRMLAVYEQHRPSLLSALEARMRDRASSMERLLAERAEKESADVRAILTELEETIREKLHDPELRQLTFDGWAEPEREQLERNMSALRVRLRQIPDEIKRETEAVALRYADPEPRMFPAAVTLLVPNRSSVL
jgi:superfamily II DNA/RNA helicase